MNESCVLQALTLLCFNPVIFERSGITQVGSLISSNRGQPRPEIGPRQTPPLGACRGDAGDPPGAGPDKYAMEKALQEAEGEKSGRVNTPPGAAPEYFTGPSARTSNI